MKVAKDLSKKYSYDELSIDLICKKAEVSTGAFYHHFKSKQGLIIEGYREYDNFFKENITSKLKSQDPIERLVELINCAKVVSFDENKVNINKNISSTVPNPYNTWTPLLPTNLSNNLKYLFHLFHYFLNSQINYVITLIIL
ncbi:TetR/AcrR family transcriptional regulator [Clostridium algidicarnis]|nr:TetR/AcrR family transcriptional regulator [Clostridium algidicarnis]MBU3227385.1 TetR/AcrR family transcriptional regulator [Clostridium algidicarnis]